MEANPRVRGLCLALVLVATAAACKQSTGTFVVLTFEGTIPEGKPIHSIGLTLQLGTRTDATEFQAPANGALALPTDATLQINSGSGDLTVEASALAEDQSVLATGTANGRVTVGQTIRITVHLGTSKSDAGSNAPVDVQQDSGVLSKDANLDGPSTVADATATDTLLLPPDVPDLGNGRNDVSLGGSGGAGGAGGAGSDAGVISGGGAPGGTGTLTMSPGTADFKSLDVGIASSIPFTVTNNGAANTGALTILLSPTAAFRVANDTCATTTLGKLGQCTFTLVFAPQAIGIASATITAESTLGLVATSSAVGVGQDRVQLTVQFAGTGGGSVTGQGLNCLSGSACNIGVVRTDPSSLPTLDLSALANSASLFSGWSGPCTGTSNCSIVMDAAKTVTATFEAVPVK